MPALYALGQHKALCEIQAVLQENEHIFAYLDDVYVICDPERAAQVFEIIAAALELHAGIRVNLGKTKMWNAAGDKPEGIDKIGPDVWVGGGETSSQGMVVLRAPVGHNDYITE